jgi:tetratricopeptide (TPR) repeat protein
MVKYTMITYSKPKELSEIHQLRHEGKFNDAIQKLIILEKKEELTTQEKLSCHLVMGSILFSMGNYNQAYEFAEQAFQESQNLKEILLLIDAYILKSLLLFVKSHADEALDQISKYEELLKTASDLSVVELKKRECSLAFVKSNIYMSKGESKKAKKNILYGHKLAKEIDDREEICASYGLLTAFHVEHDVDLNNALEYNEKSLNLAKKISYKPFISMGLLRFGVIYETKGELDLALKYFEQSLKLAREMDQKLVITASLNGLGRVYQEKSEFDQALKFCEECLEFKEEMGHRQGKFGILDTILYLCFIKNDLEKANYYFKKMIQIKQEGLNLNQETFFKLDKALLMKMSSDPDKHGQAKELLKEIIEEKIGLEVTIKALLCISDLLLNELRKTENLRILDEIQSYIIQIHEIAENLNSYWLIAEIYLLQAQLKLIIFEFKEAQNLLIEAMEIAQKYDLTRIVKRLMNEQNELSNNLNKWERLKASNAKVSERMDLTHINEQIGLLLQKRRYLKSINDQI